MAKTPTIGNLVDSMYLLREEKRKFDASSEAVSKQIAELETQLIEVLDKQNTSRGDGKFASVSISKTIVPTVTDWDALWGFILKTKSTQLLQRRVSSPAWQELCSLGKIPPGVESFEKRSIKLLTK